MQTRASCARKSSGRRNCTGCVATTGSASSRARRDRRGDERVVVGATRALHLEVVAIRKERRPVARRLGRAGAVALREARWPTSPSRAPDSAISPVGAFVEPFAPKLRAAAILVAAIGARQPVGEPADSRRATGRAAARETAASRSASCVSQTSQPQMRLDARRARRLVELDEPERVGEIGERERRHRVGDRGRDRLVDAHACRRRSRYSLCRRRWTNAGAAMADVGAMLEFYSVRRTADRLVRASPRRRLP